MVNWKEELFKWIETHLQYVSTCKEGRFGRIMVKSDELKTKIEELDQQEKEEKANQIKKEMKQDFQEMKEK